MGQRLPLLSDALPPLATELSVLLKDAGREDLAAQMHSLKIKSPCGCGDHFCASFHTSGGQSAYSIDLNPREGTIIVDVDDHERIIFVEVLFRPEYKEMLDAIFQALREGLLGDEDGRLL